jgi:3'-phosphoadenosine 5'-phosphosulfate sulfotransferase (PAPS reductase)/FAD synthetase
MKVLIFFSGGKDSQAALIWAVNKYGTDRCEAIFMDTGWENPVTYEHVKKTAEIVGVKLVVISSQKYDGMIGLVEKKKRFPSTKARFCTEELKVKPAIDYVLSQQENVIVIEGIRSSESISRSKMSAECLYFKYYFEPYGYDKRGKPKTYTYRKKDVKNWVSKYNADKVRPLFDFSAQQVIDYIQANGQTPNPLYYQGFTRVGCFPCIMAKHTEIKRIIDYHPGRWNELRVLEERMGSTFFPPTYIPKRYTDNGIYATISDVEKYLAMRNATLDMFDDGDVKCISAYKLCE